jgi:hypothetical protein
VAINPKLAPLRALVARRLAPASGEETQVAAST